MKDSVLILCTGQHGTQACLSGPGDYSKQRDGFRCLGNEANRLNTLPVL